MLTRACVRAVSGLKEPLNFIDVQLARLKNQGCVTNINKSLRLWNYLDTYCLGDGMALRIQHFF